MLLTRSRLAPCLARRGNGATSTSRAWASCTSRRCFLMRFSSSWCPGAAPSSTSTRAGPSSSCARPRTSRGRTSPDGLLQQCERASACWWPALAAGVLQILLPLWPRPLGRLHEPRVALPLCLVLGCACRVSDLHACTSIYSCRRARAGCLRVSVGILGARGA